MKNVEKIILDILVEISGTKKVTKDKDANLIECGFLDSMGVVELLTELEETFGIEIPLEEFSLDKFNTINKIVAYINSNI